jgi:hypothetical protein
MPATSHIAARTSPDSAELLSVIPPLFELVPQAGPALYVYMGFGIVVLLLLVPPFALLATLAVVALVVATALVVLIALAAAIIKAPFVLARFLRAHRLPHLSLPVLHIRRVRVRRV